MAVVQRDGLLLRLADEMLKDGVSGGGHVP